MKSRAYHCLFLGDELRRIFSAAVAGSVPFPVVAARSSFPSLFGFSLLISFALVRRPLDGRGGAAAISGPGERAGERAGERGRGGLEGEHEGARLSSRRAGRRSEGRNSGAVPVVVAVAAPSLGLCLCLVFLATSFPLSFAVGRLRAEEPASSSSVVPLPLLPSVCPCTARLLSCLLSSRRHVVLLLLLLLLLAAPALGVPRTPPRRGARRAGRQRHHFRRAGRRAPGERARGEVP